jgi:hypothetical protein
MQIHVITEPIPLAAIGTANRQTLSLMLPLSRAQSEYLARTEEEEISTFTARRRESTAAKRAETSAIEARLAELAGEVS